MPIYEYVCLDCEKRFETLVMKQKEEVECPQCGGSRLERAMSSFARAGGAKDAGGASSRCSSPTGFS